MRRKASKESKKGRSNMGHRIFLVNKKGLFGLGFDEGVYIYYADGDATTDNLRECFKDFEKFREDDPYGSKGVFLCAGNCDKQLFRDLRATIRKNSIRNSIKLVAAKGKGRKTTEKGKAEGEKTKRVRLTHKERVYVWEHPEKYGRKCNICGRKIVKISDLELDHTVPYSKGGTTMALAHRDCNKMKGSKNLRHVQTKMKLKTK